MNEANPEAARGETAPPFANLFAYRVAVGIAQGILLYVLLEIARGPSSVIPRAVFSPSLLVFLYIAPVVEIGIGQLRMSRLLLWAALLAAIVATLGFHDAWRTVEPSLTATDAAHAQSVPFPSLHVTFFAGIIVFMSYALILAGETARTWFAPYETYFETSWRLVLQIWLSAMFVAVLHLVLWSGAALFMLVKLPFLRELLTHSWFYIPVSTLAFAAGLHITDVRNNFICGTRTLLLMLMSWLLPLLVVIVAGFLASLLFTGLNPLWSTRSAAGLLLCISALMIVLINAVFKNGDELEPAPRALRLSVRVACLLLSLLAMFASYAIWLRIGQYGLSVRRVLACASAFVACCYALGYAWAAIDRQRTLRHLAPVNVVLAWVGLVVLFAVFTPLADPARLAVSNQVDRLLSGRVTPERFDFDFLRFRSAIYGQRALAYLRTVTNGPDAAAIREKSEAAARLPQPGIHPEPVLNAETLARNIVVHAQGQALPSSFLQRDWSHSTNQPWLIPACLKVPSAQCDAYLLDLTAEDKPNVLLLPKAGGVVSVFGQNAAGEWQLLGRLNIGPDCTSVRDALSQGNYRLAEPRLRDIEIGGTRLQVEAIAEGVATCRR